MLSGIAFYCGACTISVLYLMHVEVLFPKVLEVEGLLEYIGARLTVLWFKLRVVDFSKVHYSRLLEDHSEKEVW